MSKRLEDVRDGFKEELQETKPGKRPRTSSDRLTDSEDEDDRLSDVPAKKVFFWKITKQLEWITDNYARLHCLVVGSMFIVVCLYTRSFLVV